MQSLQFEGYNPKLKLQSALLELFEGNFLLTVTRSMQGVHPAVARDRFALNNYPDLKFAIEGIKITY
jgi:hypothetical protein